ncbi:hypothetical protein [Hymenobacter ruricola]|uniref:Tail specific protease N-terminal domain-containing protein n=1 Tax=Hymenobacter ruricola TaxID=2791023 RepID=A0ABS0IBY5_9BACT|nr:hypothetical protein [Hymenobacter ruricola]MBF9224286.1 hypothetical protein [Hymenobacter ruricola]
MKYWALPATLLLLVAGHLAEAAPAEPVMDLALGQRATALTRTFTDRLQLNEGEFVRLRRVHRILLASLDDINIEYAQDPTTRHAKLLELQGYYEQERTRVLTPTQVGRLEIRAVHDSLPTVNPESGGLG